MIAVALWAVGSAEARGRTTPHPKPVHHGKSRGHRRASAKSLEPSPDATPPSWQPDPALAEPARSEAEPEPVRPPIDSPRGERSESASGDPAVLSTTRENAGGLSAPALPELEVSVGGGFLHRQLTYSNDLLQALSPYDLPAGLALNAEARSYPLERFPVGLARGLGVELRLTDAPGLASVDPSGTRIPTVAQGLEAGALYRLALGTAEVVAIAAYAAQQFSFQAATGTLPSGTPSVSYRMLRLGASGRLPLFPWLTGLAEAAYLPVLGTGEIGSTSYFPRASVAAVEASLGAAVPIYGPFEGRVIADYRRCFYSMHAQPGDPYLAGGATDEYLTVTAGISARL